ncbi:hypothetical protein [Nocardia sp. NBC_01327]|uniref:hypothetical protein n=1 Tax=Nocardia sp. NBC_01327 TaxID=2903593 RepID=UPI002E0D9793|nr:hypothetical protein OG326_18875 [Nocardia sp. NBC_01327]
MTALIDLSVVSEPRVRTAECRTVEVLTCIEDIDRLRVVVAHVLERCHRRWCGRNDIDAFPPIGRWQHIERPPTPAGCRTPREHIRIAALGRRQRLDPIHGLEAALMMTSGCPAFVIAGDPGQDPGLPRSASGARTLVITLFALDGDDLSLAEGLLNAVLELCDATLLRRNLRHDQLTLTD